MQDFFELVQKARSCRRFNELPRIDTTIINWLVDCARISPCARNAQVLRYVAVKNEDMCANVFELTRWAGALKWDGPARGERPTAYIAILAPQNAGKLVHMDIGVAAQSMQLAAQSKGFGCCMHASFKQTECAKLLAIPEDMEIGLLLAFGIEKEKRVIAPMPDDENFNYWRDEENVHYVPKRSLQEVLINIL